MNKYSITWKGRTRTDVLWCELVISCAERNRRLTVPHPINRDTVVLTPAFYFNFCEIFLACYIPWCVRGKFIRKPSYFLHNVYSVNFLTFNSRILGLKVKPNYSIFWIERSSIRVHSNLVRQLIRLNLNKILRSISVQLRFKLDSISIKLKFIWKRTENTRARLDKNSVEFGSINKQTKLEYNFKLDKIFKQVRTLCFCIFHIPENEEKGKWKSMRVLFE